MTSSAWWREQQKDLFALTEPHELGMMSCMVTITHNDYVPELLANIRRGPFAVPTEDEKLEYLVTRKPAQKTRCDFENFSMEHVLSHQRRVTATKKKFMQRGKRTPLGIVKEWWDRTEAQMRAALHQHILVYFKRRAPPPDCRRTQNAPASQNTYVQTDMLCCKLIINRGMHKDDMICDVILDVSYLLN